MQHSLLLQITNDSDSPLLQSLVFDFLSNLNIGFTFFFNTFFYEKASLAIIIPVAKEYRLCFQLFIECRIMALPAVLLGTNRIFTCYVSQLRRVLLSKSMAGLVLGSGLFHIFSHMNMSA